MLAWLVLVAGCAGTSPQTPCEVVGDPLVEVVPVETAFGSFTAGDDLWYGTPPQGGAPYTPLRARVSGLDDVASGVTLSLHGVDDDTGDVLGDVAYDTRLVCANVGDSAGTWLASDVHFRYFGWELVDLIGRMATITLTVTSTSGESVDADLTGVLTSDE